MTEAVVFCDAYAVGPSSSFIKKNLVILPFHHPNLDLSAATTYLVTALPSRYPDTFVFEVRLVSARSFEIYTRRVDTECGWGQNLIVQYILQQAAGSTSAAMRRIASDTYIVGSNGGAADTPHTRTCCVTLPNGAPDLSSIDQSIFVSALPTIFKDTFTFSARILSSRVFELEVIRTDCLHGWGQRLVVFYSVVSTDVSVSSTVQSDLGSVPVSGILPLYRSCTVNICLSRIYMTSSPHADVISNLLSSIHKNDFITSVDEFLCAVYRNETIENTVHLAKRTITRFYNLLHDHDKALFSSLIHHFTQLATVDSISLQMHVAMMDAGNSQCDARRKWVLYNLLSYYATASTSLSITLPEESSIENSISRIQSACANAIDKLKLNVLQSLFLEPSKMFFRMMRNSIMEGDVDVHGMNTILSVVKHTIGIQTSRPALENDELKGFADVLTVFGEDLLWEVFCAPANLGKNWEYLFNADGKKNSNRLALPPMRNMLHCTNSLFSSAPLHFRVASDWGIYLSSMPIDELQDTVQCHINKYLYLFSRCFTFDRVAPYLIQYLLNGDDGDHLCHLQRLYVEGGHSNSGQDDVRYFIYDDDFNVSLENVVKLFRLTNIFSTTEWEQYCNYQAKYSESIILHCIK